MVVAEIKIKGSEEALNFARSISNATNLLNGLYFFALGTTVAGINTEVKRQTQRYARRIPEYRRAIDSLQPYATIPQVSTLIEMAQFGIGKLEEILQEAT